MDTVNTFLFVVFIWYVRSEVEIGEDVRHFFVSHSYPICIHVFCVKMWCSMSGHDAYVTRKQSHVNVDYVLKINP